jgi:anthranilate synthase component 1
VTPERAPTTQAGGSCVVEETPWPGDLLALHVANPDRYPFLLESVASGTSQGRYDILFAFPGETLTLDAGWILSGPGQGAGFLAALDDWFLGLRRPAGVPLPFHGGWFLYLGYELASEIEPSLPRLASCGLPVARATRVPAAVVADRQQQRAWIVAEREQAALASAVGADLARHTGRLPTPPTGQLAGQLEESDPARFLAAVRDAQRHITAGDVYQVNLSRLWSARAREGVEPWMLYQRLRRTNPAPFAGIARLGEGVLLSSSPERLVRFDDRLVETRPIAGTRPRLPGGADDEALRKELLEHPKERAEHVMLIDLERNDLGRICEAGSVTVDQFMVLESYAHVHHIVSNVQGRPRAGLTPGELVRAVFPGGTITGCPKVRCMELIAGLEQRARGPYTGSMGYLNRDGSGDLNILIRTLVQRGRALELAAGSGIVADSLPGRELEETRAKAKGLLLALGIA